MKLYPLLCSRKTQFHEFVGFNYYKILAQIVYRFNFETNFRALTAVLIKNLLQQTLRFKFAERNLF